jgi:hypothetical protein
MSSDPTNPAEQPSGESAAPREANDLVLNLDFVPTWARKPAENPYAGRGDFPSDGPRERGRPGGRDRDRDRMRGPKPGGDRPRGGGPRDRDRGRGRPDRGAPHGRPPPPVRLPVAISFLPERQQLSALVRQLNASQKAFPLSYVAHLLLAKPEFHLIKLEVRGDLQLWQFKPDGAVFLDQDSLKAHAIRLHLGEVFDETVEQTDPPAGNFNCVGRCSLSGEWLGPPNYHGYQERLLDLQRTRFPHLKIDEYRARIEMVRDPAAIEQWKEAARSRRVYRPKGQPDAAPISREEAVQQFVLKNLASMIAQGRRFIMPAALVRELPDSPLRRQLEEAWQRENRNPFSMTLALRPAFKHMRLHLFKAGRGETFVTAVVPKSLDAGHAVENIRAMLQLIHEHPGWNRAQLVEHLKPGVAPESEEANELLAPLRWLIEKGHVIEFFNGTLSAPSEPPAPKAPKAASSPADLPAPEPVQGAAEPAAEAAPVDAPPTAT